jgi:perosamine synthetase
VHQDAACAVGTTYDGVPVGVLGDIGCFSLHPRKVITTGEGGVVTTERQDLAQRVKQLRNHGATGPMPGSDPTRPYAMGTFNALGFNLRLSDIQSAVGIAQMGKLDALLAERRRIALRYTEQLSGTRLVICPEDDPGHTYQSYVIRIDGDVALRNRVMDDLAAAGIQTRPGTHAVHRLGYYATKYSLSAEAFPNACRAEDSSITLPIFPGMTAEQQDFAVAKLTESLKHA